jgi:hypothetical protein
MNKIIMNYYLSFTLILFFPYICTQICDIAEFKDTCYPNSAYCIHIELLNNTNTSRAFCPRCNEGLSLVMNDEYSLSCAKGTPCPSSPGCRFCLLGDSLLNDRCLICPSGKKAHNGLCDEKTICPDGSDSCIGGSIKGMFQLPQIAIHCYSGSTLYVNYDEIIKLENSTSPNYKDYIYCKSDQSRCMITVKINGEDRCQFCHLNYIWEKEGVSCKLIPGVSDDGEAPNKNGLGWLWILIILLIIFFICGSTLGFIFYKRKKNANLGNLEYLRQINSDPQQQ